MAAPQEKGKALSAHGDEISIQDKEDDEHSAKGGITKHSIGIALVLCAVLLGQAQMFLISSILASDTYAKPFFISYLNTVTFMLIGAPTLARQTFKHYREGTLRSNIRRIFSRRSLSAILSWNQRQPMVESKQSEPLDRHERENLLNTHSITYGAATSIKLVAPSSQSLSPVPSVATISADSSTKNIPLIPTARLALRFCLFYFAYNYFCSACLQFTTVASSTILGSTSPIWTLFLGVMTYVEKFSWRKLCGVLSCVAGAVLISTIDFAGGSTDEPANGPQKGGPWSPDWQRHGSNYTLGNEPYHRYTMSFSANAAASLTSITGLMFTLERSLSDIVLGDAMAVGGAIFYACHTIILKKGTLEASSSELHMPTFFALVSLFNAIILFPLFPILHLTGIETLEFPPSTEVWTILFVNACINLFCDMMCALAIIYTSPVVVTVGMSLQIPVSLVGQILIQARYEHPLYWVGALVVVASFVFIEQQEIKEEVEIAEEFASRNLEASLILSYSRGGKGLDEEEGFDPERSLEHAVGTVDLNEQYVQRSHIAHHPEYHDIHGGVTVIAGPSTPPNRRS